MKKLFLLKLVIFGIVFSTNFSYSDELEDIKNSLPKLLGTTNEGTEFIFGFHPCWEESGGNNKLRIYVTSQYEVDVKLTIPGLSDAPYIVKKTIPNGVIEFVLTPSEGQPYSRGAGGMISTLKPTQVWKGRGIILEADAPFIAYGVTRFNYTSDGFLALPVNKCGTEYIISSYRESANFTSQSLTPYASIIGISDNTEVKFCVGGNNSSTIKLANGTLYKPYDTIVVTLNRGDYWLIASEGNQSDLGGGYVSSNKPISVLSGSHCSYVPTYVSFCDFLIEQEIPINFWNDKYYVSNIIDRKKSSVIRIFTKEPDTQIIRNDTNVIANLTNNWGIEKIGWVETRANMDSSKPAVIRANKAINVVQYNQGMSDDNVNSDPFQMNVLPHSSFQKYIVFSTPGIDGVYGFRKNYLNIIYPPNSNKQIPDHLQLGRLLSNGDIQWEKVKNISGGMGNPFYENSVATYYNKIISLPRDGVYHLKCDEPIMAYLYGFADWDSYGYPASGSFIDPTVKDSIQPEIKLLPMVNGQENPTSGVCIITDKDNSGNDNLAFVFVDTKNTFNIDYTMVKEYNQKGKLSLVRFDWKVFNEYHSAQIVIHAVDNNGNVKSYLSKYTNSGPNTNYIIIDKVNTSYYINSKLVIKWVSNLSERIKITLLQNNIEKKIIQESIENKGEYTILLKEDEFEIGENYSIKLSGVNSQNVADTSYYFSIVDSLLSITISKPYKKNLIFHQSENITIEWSTNPVNK